MLVVIFSSYLYYLDVKWEIKNLFWDGTKLRMQVNWFLMLVHDANKIIFLCIKTSVVLK